ncbi:phosphate acetyltransferase [Salinibius halmophilus]|uniref:phosphate acetyltransferase n=1 Tax=Salinibius halmophilus TaxID=1853216 RepID=UPI000E66B627|nr:phosphate acetyltransferase [Salinibius halmophilus]
MQHSFFLAPTGPGTGLTSVCMGLVRSLDRLGVRVAFCKPVAQTFGTDTNPERSTSLIRQTVGLQPAAPMTLERAKQLIADGQLDRLLENVVDIFNQSAQDADVVVIEGLVPIKGETFVTRLNQEIARALGSEVILVAAKNEDRSAQLDERIRMAANLFGGPRAPHVLGCILNKVGAPLPEHQQVIAGEEPDEAEVIEPDRERIMRKLPVFREPGFRCLGAIRWNPTLVAPRTIDVANYLKADIINPGAAKERRVQTVTLSARTVPNMLHTLKPGALVVTPADRDDIFLASCMATLNSTPLAGILLTGEMEMDARVFELCQAALKSGLPVLQTQTNTWNTAKRLTEMNTEVPADDLSRMEMVMDAVAADVDGYWMAARARIPRERRMSPPAFRHMLVEKARRANKRIVLPEGEEPRTIQAAIQCQEQGIARCVLLGREDVIRQQAATAGLVLPEGIEILAPDSVAPTYVEPLVKLRQHKGVTHQMAESYLEDCNVLGTMMLAQDDVDGLVSGAINTTANTIRPALQLVKTKPDASIVSSIFFMLLPDQVLVYGDCAVNPDPSAEQLAEIAIQSGDSALAFGIEPRIAMISYSTGQSGSGSDVEKVREATALVKQKRPDLLVDGPLQYDAASVESVAKSKAPDSPVAGRATVFIFPDLNTGNTTYKAVQRSAHVVSIGPMLQGLRKPVNDLSRGALVEDIVYTIALTAIQADAQ